MAEIVDFENRHQVSLPEEYRDFLLTVGNGGAGPCYGVLRLGSVDLSEGTGEFPPGFLSTALPHTRQWNPNSAYPSPTWMDEEEYVDDRWITGSLPICHFGCGAMYRLIVAGECRGGIWLDDRESDGGIGPVRDGFRQWYLEWLEEQEATLSASGSVGQ